MSDRTPKTETVREAWQYANGACDCCRNGFHKPVYEAFGRWYAEEIRKAKAEALREFARNLNLEDIANEWAACSSDEHMDVAHWAAGNAASRVQMIAFDYADLEEAA